MRTTRAFVGAAVTAAALFGVLALVAPAAADTPAYCPQPPGPPGLECQGCPTYEDPVVCTVTCAGGPRQITFSNQCFAACSGYKIRGTCVRAGG